MIRRWYAAGTQTPNVALVCRRWGLTFPGPVGLAAGFDKDAVAVVALASLGFHFIEVGTVTPRPQPGNPRPRLFREPEKEALVNRMGFNNGGAQAMAQRLSRLRWPFAPVPIGINLGKNRTTEPSRAVDDYLAGLRTLYHLGDYFVVNVSSPNTPGLRDLQQGAFLHELLGALQEEATRLSRPGQAHKPLLLKIAPDLPEDRLEEVLDAALRHRLAGLIVANTWPHPQGGLSGRPLREHGHRLTAAIYRKVMGRLPIVGVGGIFTGEDAYARIRAGACLVQCYTGFVYRGPSTPSAITRELAQLLHRDGFSHVDEAVGVDASRLPDPWQARGKGLD